MTGRISSLVENERERGSNRPTRSLSSATIGGGGGNTRKKWILSIQRNRLINFFRVIACSLVLLHSFAPSTLVWIWELSPPAANKRSFQDYRHSTAVHAEFTGSQTMRIHPRHGNIVLSTVHGRLHGTNKSSQHLFHGSDAPSPLWIISQWGQIFRVKRRAGVKWSEEYGSFLRPRWMILILSRFVDLMDVPWMTGC